LEIHLLATAIFYWEFAIATLSPTPSYSILSSVSNVTPSLTSFQAAIASNFSRTLNASIAASKAHYKLTSQTTSFQINTPVTKTKLAHLQGKMEVLYYERSQHSLAFESVFSETNPTWYFNFSFSNT